MEAVNPFGGRTKPAGPTSNGLDTRKPSYRLVKSEQTTCSECEGPAETVTLEEVVTSTPLQTWTLCGCSLDTFRLPETTGEAMDRHGQMLANPKHRIQVLAHAISRQGFLLELIEESKPLDDKPQGTVSLWNKTLERRLRQWDRRYRTPTQVLKALKMWLGEDIDVPVANLAGLKVTEAPITVVPPAPPPIIRPSFEPIRQGPKTKLTLAKPAATPSRRKTPASTKNPAPSSTIADHEKAAVASGDIPLPHAVWLTAAKNTAPKGPIIIVRRRNTTPKKAS